MEASSITLNANTFERIIMPAKKATTTTQMTTNFYKINPKDLFSVNSKNKNKDNEEFYQPRHDKPDLSKEWVANLKENGVLHPPIVMKKSNKLFIAAGTRRSLGASLAGLKEITVMEVPYDKERLKRIQSAENEQRKANTVHDTLYNVMSFLQLDKNGKPQGLNFAQTGAQFGKTHQWARDMAMVGQHAPKWLLDRVEEKKIHLTAAFKLVAANLKANGTEKDLKEAYAKTAGQTTTTSTGNPRISGGVHNVANNGGSGGDARKRVSSKLEEAWATNPHCPEPIRITLQAALGIISIEDAKKLAKGRFDKWMFETMKEANKANAPAEAKGKGKGKGKAREEEEIEEDDLDLEEELNEELEAEDEESEEGYDEEEEDEDDGYERDEDADEDEDEDEDEEDEEWDDEDEEDDEDEDEDEEEEEESRPGVGGKRRAPVARARSRR